VTFDHFDEDQLNAVMARAVRYLKRYGPVEIAGAPDESAQRLVAGVIDLAREVTFVIEWGTSLKDNLVDEQFQPTCYNLDGKSGIDVNDLARIVIDKGASLVVLRYEEAVRTAIPAALKRLAAGRVSVLLLGPRPLIGSLDLEHPALEFVYTEASPRVAIEAGQPAL
jgi:hypothetical protein